MVNNTPEQNRIIETADGCVEVLACAGSGKTSTLVARIGWLVSQGVRPRQIMVLSFSNTAVAILAERLGKDYSVQTFHAYSHSLIRAHYSALGYATLPALLEPATQTKLLRDAVKACREERIAVRRKTEINLSAAKEVQRLGSFYDRMQGDGKLANELVTDPHSVFHDYQPVLKPLRRIYQRYQEEKRAAGVIDYADMLRSGRNVLAGRIRLSCKYLFVDECQDMNRGQAELLRILINRIPNVMVFGDPLQAVYSFMGGRFWKLSSLTENAQTHALTQSFRLTQCTADFVAAIGAPLMDSPLVIRGRKRGGKPILTYCESADSQVQRVVETVQNICAGKSALPSIAVLARTKDQLRCMEIGLLAVGFNAHSTDRDAAPELIKHLFNILALVEQSPLQCTENKRENAAKLERCLLTAARVKESEISKRVIAASRRKLLCAMLSPTLEGRYIGSRKVLEKLLRAAGRLHSGMRAEMGRWEPLCNRFQCLADLREYVEHVMKKPAVTLSTIHSAKGSEWDHVLVIGLTDGSLPFYREIARGALDEERRLFFVAGSRPRERLYLFQAPFHHRSSRQPYDKPSQFLTPEVRKLLIIANDKSASSKKQTASPVSTTVAGKSKGAWQATTSLHSRMSPTVKSGEGGSNPIKRTAVRR